VLLIWDQMAGASPCSDLNPHGIQAATFRSRPPRHTSEDQPSPTRRAAVLVARPTERVRELAVAPTALPQPLGQLAALAPRATAQPASHRRACIGWGLRKSHAFDEGLW